MSLSSVIEKVLEHLLLKKAKKREKVAEYLKSVSVEAEEFASIWQGILTALEHGNEVWVMDGSPENYQEMRKAKAASKKRIAYFDLTQMVGFETLYAFYRTMSSVIANRTDKVTRENLITCLGSLLRYRKIARETLDEAIGAMQYPVFLCEENNGIDLKNLHDAVIALQREVAQLKVLTENYKVNS